MTPTATILRAAPVLPVPEFADEANAAQWSYEPDLLRLRSRADEWRRRHGVPSSAQDERHVHLLLVDLQRDFCHPEGTLFVGGRSGAGAVDDARRLCKFVYENLDRITDTTATLDSHLPFQIFFPDFWVDAEGDPLEPHREISAAEVRSGSVRPDPRVAWWLCNGNVEWLERQALDYCERLERTGKYKLYLWPPHCLLGSAGHALLGVVQEARLFHAWVRNAKAFTEVKGTNVLTEHYSVLAPEVLERHDGQRLAERSHAFVDSLLSADRLLIAGQAASHCVRFTVDDLLSEIARRDPDHARRLYVLEDCMSAVAVPDPERPGALLADFTPEVEEAKERWRQAGVHIVRSDVPMAEWPEFSR